MVEWYVSISMLQVEWAKCFLFDFLQSVWKNVWKMYTRTMLLNWLYTKYLKKGLHVNCLKKMYERRISDICQWGEDKCNKVM